MKTPECRNRPKMPEKKKEAIEDIVAGLTQPIGIFLARREKWVKVRVMTIDEINNLPEVKQKAKELIKRAKSVGSRFFELRKREWKNAGVISQDEIDQIT